MSIKYADFNLTTGDNDGSSWGNAWRCLEDAVAGAPVAGDVVLCRGTDYITQTVNVNISGTAGSGHVKFVGVDESGDNVGGETRAVIDAGGGSFNAINIVGSYIWFENFEVKNAGTSGTTYAGFIFASGGYRDHCNFINCIAYNCSGTGFNGNGGYARFTLLLKCCSKNNGGAGFNAFRESSAQFCCANNNGGHGFYCSQPILCYGCISKDNVNHGFNLYAFSSYAINCVSHNNSGSGFYAYNSAGIINCRGTKNVVGITYSGTNRLPLFGYYGQDNTTDIIGNYDQILNDGSGTVVLNGSDNDYGYISTEDNNYNLSDTATFRRMAVEIP